VSEPPEPPGWERERLEAEARFARDRLALYKARMYGGRASSLTELRELERTAASAEERLRLLT
jgi:hypothetical protein